MPVDEEGWLNNDDETRKPSATVNQVVETRGDVAPAVEYSWDARFGVVGGVRFRARGRDTTFNRSCRRSPSWCSEIGRGALASSERW